MRLETSFLTLLFATLCKATGPDSQFSWKQIDYEWESSAAREEAIKERKFVQGHNLPLGLARWKNKLFVTVPRWRDGVASSLNYLDVDGPKEQLLKPYPSWKDNLVADNATELPYNSSIVSAFRVDVDSCDRLWVMDTGTADILGKYNQVYGPSVVIFDLKTDQLIRRYKLPLDVIHENSFFANIIVDVEKDRCDDGFAYIPDLGANAIVVYDFSKDQSWRISHHYFHFDPLSGSYKIQGIEFHWKDGIFSAALSDKREDGYRTVYFHAFSSTNEFCVSSEVLRNYPQLNKTETFHDFKLLGTKGENTQSSASDFDSKTKVLFYTQVNRDGIGCWNPKKDFTPENNPLLFNDPELCEFPNDLKVDEEGTLWLLTDKLQRFLYTSIDANEVNYRIFKINTTEIIKGTSCE